MALCTFTILGWLVLLTLILAIAVQLSQQGYIYLLPDAWAKPFVREGFEVNPAQANAPYKLLADVLPEKKGGWNIDCADLLPIRFPRPN